MLDAPWTAEDITQENSSELVTSLCVKVPFLLTTLSDAAFYFYFYSRSVMMVTMKSSLPLLFLLFLSGTVSGQASVLVKNFMQFPNVLSWQDAQQSCRRWGGRFNRTMWTKDRAVSGDSQSPGRGYSVATGRVLDRGRGFAQFWMTGLSSTTPERQRTLV